MIPNAGEIVELAVRRQNINISELSRRLQINRRTLYNWFQQKKLPSEVIYSIGNAIEYDFSADFHESLKNIKPPSHTGSKESKEIQANSINYWMEKYISLLEDYKDLLQSRQFEPTVTKERFV
ncbi:hypothetical protein DBR11_26475 [Pedobacter sp. HMWF019]|uniref:hypothetical protein n=1 Tax=Pedobacter sp. HMWF019 TaxID=2056856 RepID=UPI000D33A9EC|nr:hypothetical protein [Pedobacter sp. HMWF019]PTS92675.1 hypothetical protein DBR11_26475 [Pedobacter sp. HMWF019]